MRKAKALFKSFVTRGNSSQSSQSSMNSGEIEYWRSLNESDRQPGNFHVTNPFADVEELSRLSARAEIATDDMVASMFYTTSCRITCQTSSKTRKWLISAN